MPILNNMAKLVVKPLPRTITPKTHAVLDYVTVGLFFGAASWFARRNKRAALAAMICGGAELAVCLLTDYPGGARRIIDFAERREIDLGLAAMSASMPAFLAFRDDPEKGFFLAQGMLISAATALSQFPEKPARSERRSWWAKSSMM
jgi:hypothetical protein